MLGLGFLILVFINNFERVRKSGHIEQELNLERGDSWGFRGSES